MKPDLIRAWMPPALRGVLARAAGLSVRFAGQPGTWAQALARSHGYSAPAILARVSQATRAVRAGQAAFERDSVLFDHWVPPFQLLAPLLRHAVQHGGVLDVADFGGSLGSTYRVCRPFLPDNLALHWQVIEQPDFVRAGQAEFSGDGLTFFHRLADLPPAAGPRILLASSVLQYIEDTSSCLHDWNESGAVTLLLDRTPLSDLDDHALCIQQVPRHIYDASYPLWVFSRRRLLQQLGPRWRLLCEFDCPEGQHRAAGGPVFDFKGLILQRQD